MRCQGNQTIKGRIIQGYRDIAINKHSVEGR